MPKIKTITGVKYNQPAKRLKAAKTKIIDGKLVVFVESSEMGKHAALETIIAKRRSKMLSRRGLQIQAPKKSSKMTKDISEGMISVVDVASRFAPKSVRKHRAQRKKYIPSRHHY